MKCACAVSDRKVQCACRRYECDVFVYMCVCTGDVRCVCV